MNPMQDWLTQIRHPNWYHGHHQRPPFFEGWYYKLVTPDRAARYAIIPGIFLSDDPAQHHAFVQVFDGVSGRATYHRYPADQFHAAADRFDVRIGANHFTADGFTLAIDDSLRRVAAEVRFTGLTPYPVTALSPGIMGPFAYLPFMECYHGVVSLDHAVAGILHDDDQAIRFDGGRGYIEKDWGKSFPAGWVWMQTNHFDALGTSLSASIAVTPMLGQWFPGFIAAFWHAGTLHRFTTYTGARVETLAIRDDQVHWVMRGIEHRLEIHAARADASLLPGPDRVAMDMRVPETLKASIHVCLSRLRGGSRPLFDGTGECAGLEVAGDVARLVKAVNG
ncbi:MAG: tocopherol cyclase family protein [bacterium]|nr:tocopherol cyclase family protein [bacterium]